MNSPSSATRSRPHWTTWPRSAQLALLAEAKHRLWLEQARPEQAEPPGDWRVWYLRGGRGAGKSKTGSSTLARWITSEEPGEWGILAPTFGDAKRCVEQKRSGLLVALGSNVKNWNRSEGIVYCENGAEVYVDGADDGALRIQGRNLKGAWCDEIGLWRDWERAWNESLQMAVRFEPGRIVATGTPKMAHPLIAQLLVAQNVVHSVMRTTDNADNLDKATVDYLLGEYGGTTLGRQELDGEYIEALEGAILRRSDWQWYAPRLSFYGSRFGADELRELPRFDMIVHSWDTALKDKTSSDFVSGQVWGVRGPDRYALRFWHGHASLNATVAAMRDLRQWSGELWPTTPTHVLIENTANGPDAIAEMRAQVDGIHPIAAKGDKVNRALAASPALETGHCYLPGSIDPQPGSVTGYLAGQTPADVQAFVEECAMFRGDMKHLHDDQVDAWSQMVNWTRRRKPQRATIARPTGRLPRPGSLSGVR